MGSRRDRHGDLDRRRARRRGRARRTAARGRARRLRRRRPLPGGQAGPALRWVDPARQGVPSRGPARLGDERRAAPTRPRRTRARGRARLHRRAQRQVARSDRGPRGSPGRATSSTSPTGCCRRTGRLARARGCRSAWSRSTPTCCPRPTGETVAGRPGRGARLRVRRRRAPRRARRRLARRRHDLGAGGAARQPRLVGLATLADHGRPHARRARDPSCAPGTPRRPRSRRTRRRCGTRRAT